MDSSAEFIYLLLYSNSGCQPTNSNDTLYNMTQIGEYPDTFFRVSLKAVIRDDEGRVLVVKEINNANWNLPGGGMEHHETDHEAMARELKEEIGYTGDFTMRPIGTQPMLLESKSAMQLWIVYEVTLDISKVSIGDEAVAIKFIDPVEFQDSTVRSERFIYQFCAN